ncbi:MAG: hypothetical protein AMXMBFR64_43720 [Myxococcales bacterium]
MSRVRAQALALVNWKGVFYERYELDRHVTALEGDNGAGKTTVMVAAYVVLLPDMTRLRFTNLGETGATGGDKGIWGRLGELGRPSYAALEFGVRGERVLAGVHLERKGEPTVEPTPFLVTGLAPDIRLQDLLLIASGELEHVPELSELRDRVARLGARLQVFPSAREYFGALFELGITPMRLGTDEERSKLNEMLKTSMTGGMSKGLLQDLRSFLLREEGGLAETLQRMRANLDTCRRTRRDVQEAQRLEREIGAIHEAGEQMFAAALAATRLRAEEMARRVRDAEERRQGAEDAAAAAAQALASTRAALAEAVEGKAGAAQAVADAEAWARRVAEALGWAREAERRAGALARAEEERVRARERRTESEDKHRAAARELDGASEARERAAAGLADLQRGLDELHRRAAGHRRTTERLAEARRFDPLLEPDDAGARAGDAAAEQAAVDAERRDLSRRIDDAAAHRAEHGAALAALAAIAGNAQGAAARPVEPLHAARAALAEVRAWRELAGRPALREELRAAEAEARRQARVRERALGLIPGEASRDALGAALGAVEAALGAAEERARSAAAAHVEATRMLETRHVEIHTLEARAAAHRDLAARAALLSGAGAPVVDRPSLDAARAALVERLTTARALSASLTARRESLLTESRALLSGGTWPPELLALRDELTAELLAVHFDEAGDEAAELEALLGPLAHALIVPDLDAATTRAAGRAASLPTVWLVAEDAALPEARETGRSGRDVVVDEGDARRITRVPERPTLGRAARERRAAELRTEADALAGEIEEAREAERSAAALLREGDALLEGAALWLAGAPDVEGARRAARAAEAAGRAAQVDLAQAQAEAAALRPRHRALRELLPDAALLDPPDLEARALALREAMVAAEHAARELARAGDAPATLERHLEALRHPPWSDADVTEATTRRAALDARRDALGEAAEALRYVAAHREELRWTDAAARLEESQDLVPALKEQLDAAKERFDRAQSAERAARSARDAATGASIEADARHANASASHDEARQRLAESGVDPTGELLAEAQAAEAASRAALTAAEATVGRLQHEVGRCESAREAAERDAASARTTEEDERRQARPALDAWDRLRPQVEAAGLLQAAPPVLEGSSVSLFAAALGRRDVLVVRLEAAHGGPALLAEVRKCLDAGQTGEGYLCAWLLVRDWLRSRLPAQIADVAEPLLALARFRDHLVGLVERLDRQERDLRGTSEDVARGIDVQIRKAQGRVRRLSDHLGGVRFGSVRGIRVRMQRVAEMEQVLRALRSGEAQGLLFQADVPVEDALEAIFKRYGGGRTGGQRLLDYREYIRLHVEVLRQGSADWEEANPTRLSTGEAIGVGAALMMVVLTEWERDATLLRGKRTLGSLRFLFLDEANRLDQANLGTLFDLCRSLDLQLLVASPEVARAEGCTVFRLVRTRGEGGREEVRVSGRRVVTEAELVGAP